MLQTLAAQWMYALRTRELEVEHEEVAPARWWLLLGAVFVLAALVTSRIADAAEAPVGLGTAESFAVLAGAGVTNTGPSVISGDLGTSPTPAVTGFPPGVVIGGTIHAADAVAAGAQADLVTAYNDAAGRAPTTAPFPGPTDLGGLTLGPGVYKSPTSFAITGTLTLDAQGDPAAVFIFQAGSTLITAVDSRVVLVNPASACNVFWQVGSSATLGVDSTFVGTILSLTSISVGTDATVLGRLLARNASTTLDTNAVTRPPCAPPATTTTTIAGATTTSAAGATTTTSVAGATTTSVAGATTTTAGVAGATTTTIAATTSTTPATAPAATPTSGVGAAAEVVAATSTSRAATSVSDASASTTSTSTTARAAVLGSQTATSSAATARALPSTGSRRLPAVAVGTVAIALGSALLVLAMTGVTARRRP